MIITSEAVVLHSRKYSDSSAILSLYTREQGRVSVVVKGARRPKSKFGSAVLPLSVIDCSYYYKAGRDLHTLSRAESTVQLRRLTDSYDHLSSALALCEAVNLTQPALEANTALYDVIRESLVAMNAAERGVFAVFAHFCLRLASSMGFMIDLQSERSRHIIETEDEVYFALHKGSCISGRDPFAVEAFRFDSATIKMLSALSELPVTELAEFEFDSHQQREVQQFFVSYFSHHLERRVVFRTESMVTGATLL